MVKTAKDYPITTGYGCLKGYPLNQNLCPKKGYGFHRGVDRAMKVNTPLRVTTPSHPKPTGILLGKTGETGQVTGPHLHVGKWKGDKVFNPRTYGFNFPSGAKVTYAGYDKVNGNMIKLLDLKTGYTWVYCHLSRIDVEVGRKI